MPLPILLGTYDPNDVVITLRAAGVKIELVGFPEGEMITVERNQEFFNNHVGTRGEVSRAANRDATCTITLRLQQTSPSIKSLEDLKVVGNILSVPPLMTLEIYDPAAFETVFVANCWIQKDPQRVWSNNVEAREYSLFGVALITASNNALSVAAQAADLLL
jgi:hypothetical protein